MRPFSRARYMSGVCVATMLLLSWPAVAQTIAPAKEAGAAPQTSENEGQIGDIIVTAQRREERIQDVPIAISAVTSESSAALGITGTTTLQATIPSLSITRQANGAAPFLRGIGATLGDANAEGSVAIYLDGVYQPSAYGNSSSSPTLIALKC